MYSVSISIHLSVPFNNMLPTSAPAAQRFSVELNTVRLDRFSI